eukprot:1180835-Prorocentrum_minimum.AAC.1
MVWYARAEGTSPLQRRATHPMVSMSRSNTSAMNLDPACPLPPAAPPNMSMRMPTQAMLWPARAEGNSP